MTIPRNFPPVLPIIRIEGRRGGDMLPPEVIDRLRREKEQEDRPALRLPLYPPEELHRNDPAEDDEQTCNGVIVIDLL